jgi:Tfp pilus assembly protein PilF
MFSHRLLRSLFSTVGTLLISGTAFAQYTAQPTVTPMDVPSETRRTAEIHGQVVLEDGTPLAEPAEIYRVCGNMTRRETYTNEDGKFSISLDPNSTNKNFQGASEGGGTGEFGARMGNWNSTTTRTVLWGCDIRASVQGYLSSTVSLEGKDFSTPVDIGRIVLRPTGGTAASSISITSMKAPDDARTEFDKGRKDFFNKKYEKAEKHLKKATELFPQYAAAWDILGRDQRMLKQDEDAEKSFLSSIKADDKYISPYMQLAGMNAAKANWSEVLRLTDKVASLDPASRPDAYFLSAIARYNLKQLAQAEISARKAVDADKEHQFPRAALLLGNILQTKGDNKGAAEQFRNYLKMEPNSQDAPRLQAYLAKVDGQNATAHGAKSN